MIEFKELVALLSEFRQMVIDEWEGLWPELHKFYECRRCSFCCTKIPVQISRSEIRQIAKHLNMDPALCLLRYTLFMENKPYLKYPCPFYDGNGCEIYEARPEVCRRYPFTGGNPGVLATNLCPMAKEIADDVEALGKVRLDKLTRRYEKYFNMYVNHPRYKLMAEPLGGVEEAERRVKEYLKSVEDKLMPDNTESYEAVNFSCPIEAMRKLLKLKRAAYAP